VIADSWKKVEESLSLDTIC